ncbi:MAG TPA: DUF494 family protein [Candidatus Hydrogenedentes bacterium]|jgi:uncharacterized protein Smg (DUF494 family)|nr:DUF494 family protein [Candidatus Hydrogenedentota bacterium]MDY0034222.1 DUF494 family protein [FCB group bacterium]NLT62114.1 DUF494 domain-containing protein [Candidatus Hydrogenedentota bacterium]HNV22763.1 DUF494 family protein [Candidatus Hydrogenedentota bacterium]HNZ20307.1 DUF494 family protein [Candidatus Hydrogenedentota bacterium]
MKESLIELVDVILKRIQEQPERARSESGLRKWLVGQGYKKRDIDAAMKLVGARIVPYNVIHQSQRAPVRALAEIEFHKMTPEARDALSRLEFYSLISPQERETILENVVQFDGRVGLDELDYLLSWIVCGNRDFESQQTIYSVMEGQADTFH